MSARSTDELRLMIAAGEWRRGGFLRAALAAARDHVPGRRFVVRTRPTNDAAVRLAQAVGMTRAPGLDSNGFVTFAGP